jgi:Na+-translocating ferredoxin:NAD+ oxidoreductase RnfD subunit
MTKPHDWSGSKRLGGLWRFAIAISLLNVLGHVWLGFEQAWAHPLVALLAAYGMELAIEAIDAAVNRRRPRYAGGLRKFAEFLLSAHITGLAVSMLLYANERLWVIAFAAAVAIASKALLRTRLTVPAVQSEQWPTRHFVNPSNFGISVTLLLFPWVGIAPPYHFTENVSGVLDWILPAVIVCTGTLLNLKFTEKLPLIGAWLLGFLLQAVLRSLWQELPVVAALLPMTGLAFLLFTFYMVTDPATTPNSTRGQLAFGGAVAIAYGVLVSLHVVFGLFFALTIVSAMRGAYLYRLARLETWRSLAVPAPVPAAPVGTPLALSSGPAERKR